MLMVGASGFEPPTSRSRTVRSTRLSHAPNAGGMIETQIECVKRLTEFYANAVWKVRTGTRCYRVRLRPTFVALNGPDATAFWF